MVEELRYSEKLLRKVFAIESVEEVGQEMYIIGRLCKGDLSVGTVFNCTFHYRETSLEELERVGVIRESFVPVRLVVTAINAYWRLWEEIPEGWTARLTVEGSRVGHLKDRDALGILGEDAPSDWSSLVLGDQE